MQLLRLKTRPKRSCANWPTTFQFQFAISIPAAAGAACAADQPHASNHTACQQPHRMPAFPFPRRRCAVHALPHRLHIQLPVPKRHKHVVHCRGLAHQCYRWQYTTQLCGFHLGISLSTTTVILHGVGRFLPVIWRVVI
jgi:hypothetical protein